MPKFIGHLSQRRVLVQQPSVVPQCGVEFGLEVVGGVTGLCLKGEYIVTQQLGGVAGLLTPTLLLLDGLGVGLDQPR